MPVQEANAQMIDEVHATNQKWLKALQTSLDAVLDCYASKAKDGFEAVLLPTVQGTVCDTPELRGGYFKHFLEKKPLGTNDEERIQVLSATPGSRAVNYMGHYTFSLQGADGKRSDVPARFTFTYVETPRGWVIAHHHSSGMPEGKAEPKKEEKAGSCCCCSH
ncbi:MAG: DUF4440 domain-containing protein [Alphaproteobacteria bacterium]|nr:DUF4440 domain-containing protein [Alphaproteobacteria bacterium]